MQLDLFDRPALSAWEEEQGRREPERWGWSMRALRDMAAGAGELVCVFPGFMGAACERLVARGYARREVVGPMQMPEFWPDTPAGRREWRQRQAEDPAIQYRYSITAPGRAAL